MNRKRTHRLWRDKGLCRPPARRADQSFGVAAATAIRQDASVAGHRTVVVDPDGTAPDWADVIIEEPTGVVYQHQYGGTANRQGELEGYLVPVDGTAVRAQLDDLFVRRLRRVGSRGKLLEPDLLTKVREAVEMIRFWPGAQESPGVEQLRVDDDRLDEMDEAWVPVITGNGRGVLIWPNSD